MTQPIEMSKAIHKEEEMDEGLSGYSTQEMYREILSRLGEDPKLVGVSVYNFIAVGVMALLFLVVLKVILNKWKWAPLTDLANAA